MSKSQDSDVQGEGDYRSAKRYNEKAERFVDSGKAEEAGREAGDLCEKEERELKEAEKEGKSRAK